MSFGSTLNAMQTLYELYLNSPLIGTYRKFIADMAFYINDLHNYLTYDKKRKHDIHYYQHVNKFLSLCDLINKKTRQEKFLIAIKKVEKERDLLRKKLEREM